MRLKVNAWWEIYMNESIWMSREIKFEWDYRWMRLNVNEIKYEWDYIWMRDEKYIYEWVYMNETWDWISRHTHQWVMSRTHVTRMNESIWMRHEIDYRVTHISESCHELMPHVWMSHVNLRENISSHICIDAS